MPRRALLLACVLAVAAPALAQDLAARLAAVANDTIAQITTTGRKTGKPHTVPVWFVLDGDTIYLTTLNEKRDWVRNAEHTPTVTLAIGALRVQGHFARVGDPVLAARVGKLRRDKYMLGRIASWFGYDTAVTFRVDDLQLAPSS